MEQKNAMTIGIPRAMLYYRFGTMWRTFFDELHIPTVISPPTTRETLEIGSRIAVDETCLSAKLFMGHVHTLLGKCEAIFIPRYSNLDHDALFCTRFEGLYDQTRNVFRSQPQRFISCNIDKNGKSQEAAAFEALGKALGASPRESRTAYAAACKADQRQQKQWIREQEALSRSDRTRILLVGHSYVLSDPYLQKPIQDYLTENGAVCLRADQMDRAKARKACAEFSPTCRWIMNEELSGALFT